MLRALAVVEAGEVLAVHPESATLRQQLPLFVGAASGISALWSFVLTDESGGRQFVFVAAEGTLSICMVSRSRQPTPLLTLLASLIKRAAGGHTPQDGSQGREQQLLRAMPILFGALLPPPPGAELELRLWDGTICRFGAPAAPLPAADGLLLDVLSVLGLEQTLRVWCALLLERPVLLLSDCVPLLSAAAEGLVALLAPLRWEGTYVPVLPARLVEYVEAPTPFLMGASRRLVDATPSLDLSTVLVADLDRGALRLPSATAPPPPPPLPCDGLGRLEPLATLLVQRASAAVRLRMAAATTPAPSSTHIFGVAQRCFLRLLRSLLHPAALRAALQQPKSSATAADDDDDAGAADAMMGRGVSSDDPLDWEAYVSGLSAEARVYCEELRGTLMFEGLVNDMVRGATPLDEEEDDAADDADVADAAEATAVGSAASAAAVSCMSAPVLELSLDSDSSAEDSSSYELRLTSAAALPEAASDAGAAQTLLAGMTGEGWRLAATTLRETLEAANAQQADGVGHSALYDGAGCTADDASAAFARRAANLVESVIEDATLTSDEESSRGPIAAAAAAAAADGEEAAPVLERCARRRVAALHALLAGYSVEARFARRSRDESSTPWRVEYPLAALVEYDVAWRFDAGAVAEGAVAPLIGAMTRAQLEEALAALSARGTHPRTRWSPYSTPGMSTMGPSRLAAFFEGPSLVTDLARAQLARLTQREAEKARAAAAAAERASREEAAAEAAQTPQQQSPTVPPPPQPPPPIPPEGQPYNSQSPADEAPPPGGAVAVSARLLADATALFRSHADADGKVGRAELQAIRASGGFAALVRRTGWLRGARVGSASLGDGARLAFWLNVYNLLLMHGGMVGVAVSVAGEPRQPLRPHQKAWGSVRTRRLGARSSPEGLRLPKPTLLLRVAVSPTPQARLRAARHLAQQAAERRGARAAHRAPPLAVRLRGRLRRRRRPARALGRHRRASFVVSAPIP